MLTDGKILASEVVAKELEKEQGFIVTYNKDIEFAVSCDTFMTLDNKRIIAIGVGNNAIGMGSSAKYTFITVSKV